MDIFVLDGEKMKTRADAHREIAEVLRFPEYYGCNLDALWDCLGGFRGRIELANAGAMLAALDDYGCRLLSTFYEAAEDNEILSFKVIS